MVMASVMAKIGPFVSFARWLLTSTGLIRYMHPSDEELKKIALVPLQERNKKQKKHHERNGGTNGVDLNTFFVPKQNDLQLETTKVTLTEVVQLRYYSEFQWLLDFAFYALFVYIVTEVNIFVMKSLTLTKAFEIEYYSFLKIRFSCADINQFNR